MLFALTSKILTKNVLSLNFDPSSFHCDHSFEFFMALLIFMASLILIPLSFIIP